MKRTDELTRFLDAVYLIAVGKLVQRRSRRRFPRESRCKSQSLEKDRRKAVFFDLLHDVALQLTYARGVTATLADLIHEADKVDCKHLELSLEAIAAMTLQGTRQLGEARAQMSREAARARSRAC